MDQAALDEMGSKGPWIIEERSSWPRVAARLNAVYAWMLGRQKVPAFPSSSLQDLHARGREPRRRARHLARSAQAHLNAAADLHPPALAPGQRRGRAGTHSRSPSSACWSCPSAGPSATGLATACRCSWPTPRRPSSRSFAACGRGLSRCSLAVLRQHAPLCFAPRPLAHQRP